MAEISAQRGSIDSLKDLLQKNLMALRQFKQTNSMAIIAQEAIEESNRKISARTLRKWYNEFEEFNKFKEDLRGCYERNFCLDEYGCKRRFELYSKNE